MIIFSSPGSNWKTRSAGNAWSWWTSRMWFFLFLFLPLSHSNRIEFKSPQLPVFCKAWILHPLFSGSPRKGGTYWHQRKSGGCQTSTFLPRIYLIPGQAHLKGLNSLLVIIYLKFCCELVLLSLTLSRVPAVPRDRLAILVLVVSRLVQEQSLNIKSVYSLVLRMLQKTESLML